jgi:hypothetical protein
LTTRNSVKNSSEANDLDSKKIAKSMLASLKRKSFKDELGFLDTNYYIVNYGSPAFRLKVSTTYPDVRSSHLSNIEVVEFCNSTNLKFLFEIKREVRWLLIKQSCKTLFKFCFFMLGVIAILKLIC